VYTTVYPDLLVVQLDTFYMWGSPLGIWTAVIRLRSVNGRTPGIYGPVHHNSTSGIKKIVIVFFGRLRLFQDTCGLADR
jgi:hypothetical protein